jgi:hypothetical protein
LQKRYGKRVVDLSRRVIEDASGRPRAEYVNNYTLAFEKTADALEVDLKQASEDAPSSPGTRPRPRAPTGERPGSRAPARNEGDEKRDMDEFGAFHGIGTRRPPA